jgi:solute carrier family 8 (sodium/calcium exchanger)
MSMPEPDEGEELNCTDYTLHILSFYWKFIMAFIPPTSYWGGWATFLVSLSFTGVLTAMVGDLAGMFGCVIGLNKTVTAITFIALGTSIPDTFASKLAAQADEYADAAIGNVTGSNSVNVFLGLGFPWTLASIYHAAQGSTYEVPAGSLAFSVMIFTICAVTSLCMLCVKRRVSGGELGGQGVFRWGVALVLVFLWFLYVLLSSLQTYGHIS